MTTAQPRLSDCSALVFIWTVSWFFLAAAVTYEDSLFLILIFTIVPLVLLGLWAVVIPIRAFFSGMKALFQRRWLPATGLFLVPALGAAAVLGGLQVGQMALAMRYGTSLINEVTRVKGGGIPTGANGLFSSEAMAFQLTGGFLDISKGLLYDAAGQADRMMPQEPGTRPSHWQSKAVDIVSCRGSARHIYGKVYMVTVSSYDC